MTDVWRSKPWWNYSSALHITQRPSSRRLLSRRTECVVMNAEEAPWGCKCDESHLWLCHCVSATLFVFRWTSLFCCNQSNSNGLHYWLHLGCFPLKTHWSWHQTEDADVMKRSNWIKGIFAGCIKTAAHSKQEASAERIRGPNVAWRQNGGKKVD